MTTPIAQGPVDVNVSRFRLEQLLFSWATETKKVEDELRVLRHANEILSDNSMLHDIQVFEMKLIQLQRCAIQLQQELLTANA